MNFCRSPAKERDAESSVVLAFMQSTLSLLSSAFTEASWPSNRLI